MRRRAVQRLQVLRPDRRRVVQLAAVHVTDLGAEDPWLHRQVGHERVRHGDARHAVVGQGLQVLALRQGRPRGRLAALGVGSDGRPANKRRRLHRVLSLALQVGRRDAERRHGQRRLEGGRLARGRLERLVALRDVESGIAREVEELVIDLLARLAHIGLRRDCRGCRYGAWHGAPAGRRRR